MFKRPRLRATSHLVNAPYALGLLFLASACSPATDPPETPAPDAPSTTEIPEQTALSLPAVWDTSPLDGPVKSIGIVGQLGSTIGVVYDTGGLQLFDFDGARITTTAEIDVGEIADGRYLLLDGTPFTVFPGIDQAGAMKAYLHNDALPEPIPLDLQTQAIGTAAGLCSRSPLRASDGVMLVAFWTEEAPTELHTGRIVEVGDDLTYLLEAPVTAGAPITSCVWEGADVTVFSAPIRDATALERNGRRHILTLDTSGNYSTINDAGAGEPLTIRDGISVRVPVVPTAMAGTGDARGGGYPGGLLVVSGEIANGDHRIALIDPSDLTLSPLGVPTGRQILPATPSE